MFIHLSLQNIGTALQVCSVLNNTAVTNQVKRTPKDNINEFIIWKLKPLVVSRMQ